MAFNLPQFLRRTPRSSLREYFRFRSIDLSADFDWSSAPRSYVDSLRAEVENLPMSLGNWRSGRSLRTTLVSCWPSRAWTAVKPGTSPH